MDEIIALGLGVTAAISFPIFVVIVHGRREARRNRRMGSRRTDKIKLTDKD